MSNSLTSLLKKSSLDDHDALLKAAEDVLKSSSSDSQAQQVKAIALLKLERYDDALKYFEQNSGVQDGLPEAYAYTLYKKNRFEEAVKVASAATDSRCAQHIALQAAYRAEDWNAATAAYETLAKSNVPSENFDLRINKLALDAEGLWLEKLQPATVPRVTTDDLSAFESAYNAACISVAKGQLEEADVLLKRAISLCEHNEDLSSADKNVELVPLRAQRLYVLQQTGKTEDASILAKELEDTMKDAAVDAKAQRLAENNILAASGQLNNPFMAYKLFKQASISKAERFFSIEAAALFSNERAVEWQSLKYDGLINAAKTKLAKAALPSTSSDILLTSMFEAAATARGNVSKAAIRQMLPELEKRPNDVGLVVTIIQLNVMIGNTTAAVDLLQSFFARLEKSTDSKDRDARFLPGLVGLMVSLFRSQGRRSQLKQELAKSAAYWRSRPKAPASLLRAAGIVLLESSNSEDAQAASDIFDKLYSQEPKDRSTIAGYIASHATNPSADIKSLAEKLSSVADLTAAVDVDAIENAGIPQSANALAIAQASQSRKRAATDDGAARKKRIRKSRLPKDYDPNKKPDPERWLPLRDRSTYKPKKKKGRKDDRTQGGGNVNESLDISNRPAGTGTEVVNGSAGGGKKKKGKGKK